MSRRGLVSIVVGFAGFAAGYHWNASAPPTHPVQPGRDTAILDDATTSVEPLAKIAPAVTSANPLGSPDEVAVRVAAPDAPAPQDLPLASLDTPDLNRILLVNGVLRRAHRPPIAMDTLVSPGTVEAIRLIVDDAERRVDDAKNAMITAASAATRPLANDVIARVRRGELAGLPVKSPSNPPHQLHDDEAVTTVLGGGTAYVVRIRAHENPRLASSWTRVGEEEARRLADFDVTLRELLAYKPR